MRLIEKYFIAADQTIYETTKLFGKTNIEHDMFYLVFLKEIASLWLSIEYNKYLYSQSKLELCES